MFSHQTNNFVWFQDHKFLVFVESYSYLGACCSFNYNPKSTENDEFFRQNFFGFNSGLSVIGTGKINSINWTLNAENLLIRASTSQRWEVWRRLFRGIRSNCASHKRFRSWVGTDNLPGIVERNFRRHSANPFVVLAASARLTIRSTKVHRSKRPECWQLSAASVHVGMLEKWDSQKVSVPSISPAEGRQRHLESSWLQSSWRHVLCWKLL